MEKIELDKPTRKYWAKKMGLRMAEIKEVFFASKQSGDSFNGFMAKTDKGILKEVL